MSCKTEKSAGDCYETAIRDDEFRNNVKRIMTYSEKFPAKPIDQGTTHYRGIKGLPDSITCPTCSMTSYNANDIAQGYCGNCHDLTSEAQSDEVRRDVANVFGPVRMRGPQDSITER